MRGRGGLGHCSVPLESQHSGPKGQGQGKCGACLPSISVLMKRILKDQGSTPAYAAGDPILIQNNKVGWEHMAVGTAFGTQAW